MGSYRAMATPFVPNLIFNMQVTGMQVLSLDYIYIYIYIYICDRDASLVQVLSGWGRVLSGWGQVLSWMQVLSSDASLVVGCKSCRRVKVGRARNTPLKGIIGRVKDAQVPRIPATWRIWEFIPGASLASLARGSGVISRRSEPPVHTRRGPG